MSETKFTKGPWRVLPEEADKDYIRIRGTILGFRYKIANVIVPVYDGVNPCEAEESRANAHLIAAATTLYAELERITNAYAELLGHVGIPRDKSQLVINADAALRAARGEA